MAVDQLNDSSIFKVQ